ncbi:MAG: hypothetical protein LBL45_07550 [Treponema sp.]|jgi:hypothetical protein|nr:hypothetical protein [Treponema sp.]
MKRRFWNAEVEVYEDGSVKAAVLWSREAETKPADRRVRNPGREVFSLWYESEGEARGMVLEALAESDGAEEEG